MLEQALSKAFFLGLPAAAVAAVVSLIVGFRRARAVERQQLKWLVYAAGVLALASVIQDPWLGGWATAAVNLAQWAIPAAIGVAILRYRLYDIDPLIDRTLVYGLLTALLAAIYTGAVLVLGQLFGGIGAKPPSWAVAGATLAGRRRVPASPPPPPGSGRPAFQPTPLRRRSYRGGIQRQTTRSDRPGHALGRAVGGGQSHDAADDGLVVAATVGGAPPNLKSVKSWRACRSAPGPWQSLGVPRTAA
jgi:hypothetical protein